LAVQRPRRLHPVEVEHLAGRQHAEVHGLAELLGQPLQQQLAIAMGGGAAQGVEAHLEERGPDHVPTRERILPDELGPLEQAGQTVRGGLGQAHGRAQRGQAHGLRGPRDVGQEGHRLEDRRCHVIPFSGTFHFIDRRH
jgi:hypothetical protein